MNGSEIFDHLRPFQRNSIAEIFDQIRRDREQNHATRAILQLPTGSGKTVVAAAIVRLAVERGRRLIFCVPALVLIEQTIERFVANGINRSDIGVIQSNHPLTNPALPIQIASIQTLARRNINRFPHADLVIIDEAHVYYGLYDEWFESWNNIPFLGLSATPWTKGLGNIYKTLIQPITLSELVEAGWLSDFRAFAKGHPDLSNVHTRGGDYIESELEVAMHPLTADIVKTYIKDGESRPALCFAVNCAHAQELQQDFCANGISAAYMDAYTEAEDRQQIFDDFTAGRYQVICNVGVLTTGLDLDVRLIILARPTKSEILYVQIIGRGLRIAEGKEDCLIFDHSSTTSNLGFVTDIHHDSLDDGKKNTSGSYESETPLPKECPKCQILKAPGVHICPNCGFEPVKQSDVFVVPGELIELERTRAKAKLNRNSSTEEKTQFLAELKCHAAKKGFKRGWAQNQFREKFGVWPNKYKGTPPADSISPETANWITSRNIAYFKSMESKS